MRSFPATPDRIVVEHLRAHYGEDRVQSALDARQRRTELSYPQPRASRANQSSHGLFSLRGLSYAIGAFCARTVGAIGSCLYRIVTKAKSAPVAIDEAVNSD